MMDEQRPAKLRIVAETDSGPEEEASPLQPAFPVDPLAELGADIVEATGLVAADKLARPEGGDGP